MRPQRAGHKNAEDRVEAKAIAREAIDRFARVLALTGMSREQMAYVFREACARAPKSLLKSGQLLERELVDAAHILTLWLSDPNYLDQYGEPLRIRSSGALPSLYALSKRLNPELKLDRMVKYLVRTGSVTRVGQRYVVRQRNVSFSSDPELAYAHGLQAVLGLLRTIEDNALPKKNQRLWLENMTGNPRVPARLRTEFDTKLCRLDMDFLNRMDADMQRAEQARPPGEPTVRLKVGLYQYVENSHRPSFRAPRELAWGRPRK
jgi:hypothetical protein